METREIRHDRKFDKFAETSVLKNIGDKLARLLYGDGKTLGTTPDSGILGTAQMLLIRQHDLMSGPIRVYVPQRCTVLERPSRKLHQFTDPDYFTSIKQMVAHAQRHGVDIKIVVIEN